jgi:hypothetical protein
MWLHFLEAPIQFGLRRQSQLCPPWLARSTSPPTAGSDRTDKSGSQPQEDRFNIARRDKRRKDKDTGKGGIACGVNSHRSYCQDCAAPALTANRKARKRLCEKSIYALRLPWSWEL